MASGARAVGALALALVVLPLAAVAWRAGGASFGPGDIAALRFTLMQAALSAALSVTLAIPVARALARRDFPGRGLLVTLMGAPFLLPSVVAALGLLAVFGRAGAFNAALGLAGIAPLSIYGLQGVLIAHVFLNLPLAVRMILLGWQAIPAERFRLAQSLSFTPRDIARHLERPMLREVLPGALATVFAICLTSFAVVLMLGGGPRATTLELAIYQSVRLDFDLSRAAGLALVQVAAGGGAAMAAWHLARRADFGAGHDRPPVPVTAGGWRCAADAAVLITAAAFLLVPLAALVLRGLPWVGTLPAEVWRAAARSLGVSVCSALLTVSGALTLALAVARGERGWLDLAAALPLATSGLVLGTGLFMVVQPLVAPSRVALAVTVLVNSLMALPFCYRLLLPDARALEAGYGRLAASLGLAGAARLRLLTLPRLARPLGLSAGLAGALSMGDLGVIALFADRGGATLPLMVQRLSAAYRTDAAAGASLVLIALSLALFWAFDTLGRRHADT